MSHANLTCPNCGRELTGRFCAHCGQAEHDGHPPTIRHFLHDLAHEFLHVDGRIFLTLKALFLEPGRLTEEYWAFHIASWVRPIRIFLIVVALQALVSQGQGPLNRRVNVERSPYGDLSVTIADDIRLFEDHEERIPASREEILEFSHKFEQAYAAVRYSSVLVFALLSWLIYRRRQPYFVSHLILGLHFYSFWYSLALLAGLAARLNPLWNNLATISVIYLFLALGRLFREPWYTTLAKTAVLYFLVFSTELGLGYAVAAWIQR